MSRPGDDDITPQHLEFAPEQLSPRAVAQIERVLGRPPNTVHVALAARYQQEASDPFIAIAQLAMDVHDLKRPIGIATKIAYGLLAGAVGGAIYVCTAIWGVSERNTAFDFRIKACEERSERVERAVFRPQYPVADKDPHP